MDVPFVPAGDEGAVEILVGRFEARDALQSQFLDQAVLQSAEQPFHAAFGLGEWAEMDSISNSLSPGRSAFAPSALGALPPGWAGAW